MASRSDDQKRMLTAHFGQRAVIKFCANSGMTATETSKFFSDNSRGKSVQGRLFLTGTRDFGKIEWASVTISGERNPVFPTALRTFKTHLFSVDKQRLSP